MGTRDKRSETRDARARSFGKLRYEGIPMELKRGVGIHYGASKWRSYGTQKGELVVSG